MKAFISYCHADHYLMVRFRKHLKPIEEKFGINVFSDKEILPGEEWEKRIWDEFAQSNIIFLLVSIDFLNSEFCFKKEFKKAIDRHKRKKAIVIPIILSPCGWPSVPDLAQLQALPTNSSPIKGGRFKTLDGGFTDVISGLDKLFTEVLYKKRNMAIAQASKPSLEKYVSTKYKAVFFDLDGTLIRGRSGYENFRYSWQLVWSSLGFQDSERKKYYQQYLNQLITYKQWCDITRDIFREKGLLKSHFYHMAKKVRLTKNCKETLRILRQRGLKTIIVSGGINSLLEAVFPDYFDYFDYVYINKFRYDNSGLLESIETTPYDFEGKYHAVLDICARYGISLSDCVFVGEGRNDIHVVRELVRAKGLTIGYPSEMLSDYVDYDLWKDQLDAILEVIFNTAQLNPKLPFLREVSID